MTFEEETVSRTVRKLLNGEDYREEVVNAINSLFFDFSIKFFRQILDAKLNDDDLNMNWYMKYFISSGNFAPDESAIYAGLNRKTITNIYGTSSREIVLNAAMNNLEYLHTMINELESDSDNGLAVTIKISYNNVTVNLSLTESLIVINALATKKIQIRGGAWSAIGKRVEKPLIDELCRRAGVPNENRDNKIFIRDRNLSYDREVDYKLISRTGKVYRVEVKLMGKGNPESADATIARDTDIFIADTLSEQNCAQLKARGVDYLILRGNNELLNDFIIILDKLNISHKE